LNRGIFVLRLVALVLALAGLAFLTVYPAYFGRAAGLPYISISSAASFS
jgi:hypothetical protein